MEKVEEPIKHRFEDIEDMMDHAHEQIMNAVYHFSLCTKIHLPGIDGKVIKALMINFMEDEFDDLWPKLVPGFEIKGNETLVYGLIIED